MGNKMAENINLVKYHPRFVFYQVFIRLLFTSWVLVFPLNISCHAPSPTLVPTP